MLEPVTENVRFWPAATDKSEPIVRVAPLSTTEPVKGVGGTELERSTAVLGMVAVSEMGLVPTKTVVPPQPL